MNTEQLQKTENGAGFIAALDQSGGSTPKALEAYGIDETSYANEAQMFDLVHEMRSRIMTSPAFTGERVLGAILFEMTMERQVAGKGAAEYLWEDKNVVPFVKVDQGLAQESNGVRLMKPLTGLDDLLARATSHGVFGTKMRSVVLRADGAGIDAVVDQQFEIGRRILEAGLVPIIEPEVDIHSLQKAEAEGMVTAAITAQLDQLAGDQRVMLKLTLPDEDDLYSDLVQHPRVLRVVALSGGYSLEEANERLARNHGVVASFSRALTGGLSAQQSETEFDTALDAAIGSIFRASAT
jgi:fructose-bisphosphate aldolase class I